MTGKIGIFGSGPCARAVATDLIAAGAELILVARDTVDFNPRDLDATTPENRVEILEKTRLAGCTGSIGRFTLTLSRNGETIAREVASVVIAEPETREPNLADYGLTPSDRVMSLSTFRALAGDPAAAGSSGVKTVAFLNGIGGESHPVISEEVMGAALATGAEGQIQTYIFTKNLKVAGDGLEALYRRTKSAGTIYLKFTDDPPKITTDPDGSVQIEFRDEVTGTPCRLTPDRLVVDETIRPSAYAAELAALLGIESDADGFAQADNVHRLPVATNRKGIVSAGAAREVMPLQMQLVEAGAAALSVMRRIDDAPAGLARISPGQCIRCLTCLRVCPYGAIERNARVAVVEAACEGCGICTAECPRQAIRIEGLAPGELLRDIGGNGKAPRPAITAFCCSRSAVPAAELARSWGLPRIDGLSVIEVPCAGSISTDHLMEAFTRGADGVLVLTCHEGNCHSGNGNGLAWERIDRLAALFESIGFEPERIRRETLASNMGAEFAQMVARFRERISPLGPSRLSLKTAF